MGRSSTESLEPVEPVDDEDERSNRGLWRGGCGLTVLSRLVVVFGVRRVVVALVDLFALSGGVVFRLFCMLSLVASGTLVFSRLELMLALFYVVRLKPHFEDVVEMVARKKG